MFSYKLTPRTRKYFDKIAKGHPRPASDEDYLEMADSPLDNVTHKDFVIEINNRSIKCRRYRSFASDTRSENLLPSMIFYHGGGFEFDSLNCHHSTYTKMASSGMQIFAVSTRILPAHPFPAGLYDAYDAAKFLYAQAEKYCIDRNVFVIGGSSFGGNLAAVVVQMAQKDPDITVTHQVLLSPNTDLTCSYHAFDFLAKQDILLSQEILNGIYRRYSAGQDPRNSMISPALALTKNLCELPPTVIVVTEFDGARNDSELYALRLQEAGVNVIKYVVKGHAHNAIVCRKVSIAIQI